MERAYQETSEDHPVDDTVLPTPPTPHRPPLHGVPHHLHPRRLLVQTPQDPQTHPLRDAVQPVMSPPQQQTCQGTLTVAMDANIVTPPPLAQEIEVETQPETAEISFKDLEIEVETQPETAEISFKDLVKIPVKERLTTSGQRAKPPSWNLTSDAHFAYVQKGKEKGPKPNPKKKTQQDPEPCTICQHAYGDKDDPKCIEEWLSCAVCSQWYHETCAEDNGVIDDMQGLLVRRLTGQITKIPNQFCN
ncbi:hypothetical protein SKAU_G00130900 [Synaphobranchus kaupii]|uniref:Zinc finger PHD-type domain-containing protein n=1 Tax=Synaphobranchus kaupii TaxID=118154 RepID=A0A9Q1FQS6_SYNKA|nr:hypothetical protein SKAU_G00130900 [Synaphobranchus kaupii]